MTGDEADAMADQEMSEQGAEDFEDGPKPGEECGRWDNARLTRFCTKAGTKECEFECPYRKR